jgi:hypothetical protein
MAEAERVAGLKRLARMRRIMHNVEDDFVEASNVLTCLILFLKIPL